MQNCSTCGQPLKLIPAGISKNTGKPYSSFLSCPNRCKQSPQQPPTKTHQFAQKLDQEVQDKKWNDIAEGKVRYGFAIEAFKEGKQLDVALATKINNWVKYVMTNKISHLPSEVNQDENMSIDKLGF